MSSASFNFIVPFLFFLQCVQIVIGANRTFNICSTTSGYFTPHSPYENSLNKLLGELRYKTPLTGFGSGSVGLSKGAHTSGLSLCRGDVTPKDCMACVVNASAEILKTCPRNKAGSIWYDHCFLKYSNSNFLGKIDILAINACNANNVSDPRSFNAATKKLLTSLSNKASSDRKMYASGVIKFDGSVNVYGLAQCTRDISSASCKACLLAVAKELPISCVDSNGGTLVCGSCNIRYEIYPFFGV